jgi:hypothetical protein
MEWSRSTCITVTAAAVLLLLLPRFCSPAGDKLTQGESLTPGETIVSDGGAFVLGFFAPSNATPGRQYVGIWYNNIPVQTVVWVANRDAPVTVDERSGNNSSSSAPPPPSLALANDTTTTNIVLSDAAGRVVWTTNVVTAATTTTSSGGSTTAVLLNSGNLVLRSPNGTTLWQSFDHPTDTFIPDMKVGLRYRTHDGARIVSWRGPGDPSPGTFSYGMDPSTSLQMLVWNGTRAYWRSSAWTGYMTVSRYHATTGTVIYVAVVDGEEEIYMTFYVNDGAPPTRYVVTGDGRFQLLSWNRNASAWTTLESWPSRSCSPYGSCGAYGYCDNTLPVATCKCLDGFEPASQAEWSGGVFSAGCRRSQALAPCGGGGEGDAFLAMPNMKVPDKFVLLGNMSSGDECAAECRRNCSCVAYAYANLRSSSAKGDIARCLVWTGELVDTQMIGVLWGITAETLHLRVPAGFAGSNFRYYSIMHYYFLFPIIRHGTRFSKKKTFPAPMSLFQNRNIFFGGQRLLAIAHQTYPFICVGTKTRSKIVRILLPVLASIFMLSCILLVWFCKTRGTLIYFSFFCKHICYHKINATHILPKEKKG